MLKLQNKKVINRLSMRTLAARRKKNVIVILAITLTAMMFTALFTIAGAMNKSLQESTMREVGGSSMAGLKCILPEDYEKIAKDPAVKSASYRIFVGTAENEELLKVPTEVDFAEDEDARSMFCYPSVGTMPKERLEIATSTLVLEALGIQCKVGETVPLTISVGDKWITENFTLSGYWEGDVVSMAQMCFVSEQFCKEAAPTPKEAFKAFDEMDYTGYWMMDINYANSWNIEQKTIDLLERNGYDSNHMDYGINWAYTTSSIDPETIVFFDLILFLILISGYLIIYNIFSLNVVGDIQSYGLLKTIGTTEEQLKRLVRRQAFLLSLIGIPCGLVFGTIVGKCLFPLIISIFNTGGVIKFSMHPLLFVGAALFSFMTVWMSCNKPCKIAAKVSPIEAVRYTDTSYHGKKKEKKTKKVTPFSFGLANLGRNWKKVIVVVLSLSLSMILLDSVYGLVSGFDKDKFVSQYLIGDAMVTDARVLNYSAGAEQLESVTPKIQKDLQALEGVEEVHQVYYASGVSIPLDDFAYKRLMDFAEAKPRYFADEEGEIELDVLKERKMLDYCDLYGLDQWGTEQLTVVKGKLDWEKFNTGNYILMNTFGLRNEVDALDGIYYDVGEKLELQLPDGTSKEYEVMAITGMPYAMTSRSFTFWGTEVILPETEYLAQIEENGALLSMLSVSKEKKTEVYQALENYTENEQPHLTFVTKQTYAEQFGSFIKMFEIVGGGLSFVLAWIGIMNFINAIITGILARKKELAMMEAVGMTGGQMKGMLIWEGIFYIILAGAFSIAAGGLISVFALRSMSKVMWFFSYHFTVMPILLCMPVLICMACVIPVAAYRNMVRESVVDRMRGEE